MAKNYSNKIFTDNSSKPRNFVIKRILAFSKSYESYQSNSKYLDLLKN